MTYIRVIILGIFLSISFIYAQEGCKKADADLNKVYKLIMTKYKSDTLFTAKLKKAQIAWIKFRDAHIDSHFPTAPKEDPQERYGSVLSECQCNDLEILTRERIKHLEMWLKGYEEGDVCHGSVKN